MSGDAQSSFPNTTQRTLRKRKRISYVEVDLNDIDNGAIEVDGHNDQGAANYEPKSASTNNDRPTKKPKLSTKKKLPGKAFRFLDLPAELRNEVYHLALVNSNDELFIMSMRSRYQCKARRTGDRHLRLAPRLLRVCKQIYTEGIPVLYRQRILFLNTLAMSDFIATIGFSNQRYLTRLRVANFHGGSSANFSALAMLQDASILQELTIDCHDRFLSRPKRAAAQIFRAAQYFLCRSAVSHGSVDAALAILRLGKVSLSPYYPHIPREELKDEAKQWVTEITTELRRLLIKRK